MPVQHQPMEEIHTIINIILNFTNFLLTLDLLFNHSETIKNALYCINNSLPIFDQFKIDAREIELRKVFLLHPLKF